MRKKKQAFSIFKKKLSNGVEMYYYTTYDHEGKRRQFSTNTIDYQEAVMFCMQRATEGKLIPNSKVIFSNYVKNWFIHGRCPYTKAREQKGKVYSKSSIDNKRRTLEKHILPTFGTMRLDFITAHHIEEWLQGLKDLGLAANTLNQYFSLVQTILSEAVRTDIISKNVCNSVIRYKVHKTDKKLLTEIEYETLFNRDSIDEIWGGDMMNYYINYLASVTGMRIGELLALKLQDIKDTYIEVNHSYDQKYALKSTKNGKKRIVPITAELSGELKQFCSESVNRFIFPGSNPFKPASRSNVLRTLKRALNRIGINEEERSSRGLNFHSWRHYANTLLRASGTPEVYVRSIIGHSSIAMSDNYTHLDMVEYSRSFSNG